MGTKRQTQNTSRALSDFGAIKDFPLVSRGRHEATGSGRLARWTGIGQRD